MNVKDIWSFCTGYGFGQNILNRLVRFMVYRATIIYSCCFFFFDFFPQLATIPTEVGFFYILRRKVLCVGQIIPDTER